MSTYQTVQASLSTSDSYESQMANYGSKLPIYTAAKKYANSIAAFFGKEVVGEGDLIIGGANDTTFDEDVLYLGCVPLYNPQSNPYSISFNLGTAPSPSTLWAESEATLVKITTSEIPFVFFREVITSGGISAIFSGYRFTLQDV